MTRYEYSITSHNAEDFRSIVYFCSESGECGLEEIDEGQADKLVAVLNEIGRQGWELVQISYQKDGMVAIWKRPIG